jgi:hypothetical protein
VAQSLTDPDVVTNVTALSDPEPPVTQPVQVVSDEEAALKAFAYTEATRERGVTENKTAREQRVRDTLRLLGKDPEVDSFEAEITAIRQRRFSDSQIDLVERALFGVPEAAENISDSIKAGIVPVEDELLIRASEAPLDTRLLLDEADRDLNFDFQAWVRSRRIAQLELDTVLADIVAGADSSFSSLWWDLLAEAMVPFALSSSSAQFASEVERLGGGDKVDRFMAGVEGFFLPGNARDNMRKFVMSIPPEDRPRMARQLALYIRDNSGIFGGEGNDVQTIDWIETVISSADEGRHGFDWDRTLYNMITLLDAVPFLTKIGRGVAGAAKGWFGQLARINRSKARDIIKENLADPQVRFTSNPEDLATGQLPKTTLDDVNANPSITMDDSFNQQLPRQAGIVQAADNRAINYTAQEVNALAERLSSAYQSVKGGIMSVNKFVMDVSQGDRIGVSSFYVRTRAEGGWNSPRSVLDAAEKITDGDLTGVRFLVKDGDEFVPHGNTAKEFRERFGSTARKNDGNEYFIQIKRDHFVSQIDQMAFGGNPVNFTAGGFGRYLGDATAQFTREVWEPAFVALGRGSVFEKETLDLVQPFWGLGTGKRRRVVQMIELGAERRVTFTPRQLMDEYKALHNGKDITIGEMKAYYAFRNGNDAVWATANRQAYREMSANGYRTLRDTASGEHWITRPLRSGDETPVTAYNTQTRRIETLTPSQVSKWEKAGGGIEVTARNDAIVRGNKSTNFIIRPGTRAVEMARLPINVLKYEEGYVARMYKDNFFVARRDVVEKNGKKVGPDGKPLTNDTSVMTARTLREAEDIAARLTSETGVNHEAVNMLADSNFSKVVNDTLLLEQDRLIFAKRTTDGLTRGDGTPTPLADPVEAYHRATKAVGRAIGIEDYIKIQEQRFIQTYSDIIDANKWQRYKSNQLGPQAITDDLGRLASGGGAQAKKAGEAQQLWRYYQMLRNTEDPVTLRLYRSAVGSIARGVEKLLDSPSAGEFIARTAEWDPFSFTKGIVFATLIASNPTRQYALQTMQFSFLTGANPRIALASIPDFNLMRVGLAMIDTPQWDEWVKMMAKKGKYTKDEVKAIVTQYRNSGLVAEIDSYAYIGAQIAEKNLAHTTNPIVGGFQALRNAVNTPIRMAKKYGFVAGESNNLAMTYSFALREYLDKTGKNILSLTQREWQQIGAQASGYALAMHKAGTVAYQQGFISTLTQFWSIQHKATMAMMPGRFGSKAFTNQQKAGIAATQLAMYGPAGWGVVEIVRDIFAETRVLEGVDPETSANITRIVSTGIMELALNEMLSSITQEDVDSSFSSSFAPAGAPIATVSDFLTTSMQLGLLDGVMQQTAGGSTFGKYADMAEYIYVTMNMDGTLPDTPSKLERILINSVTPLSGVSQGLKGFYALRMGQLMTQYGDHRIQMSWPEALLKGVLGVSSNAEEDFRRLQEIDGKGFYFDQNNAEETANMVWRAQVRNLLFFEGQGEYDFNKAMAEVEGERGILSMLRPDEFEMVREAYLKIVNDMRGTEEDIFEIMMRFAEEGAATPERIIREVEQNLVFEKYPNQREQMLYTLENMINGRDERMEWYRDENRRFDTDLNFLLEEAED